MSHSCLHPQAVPERAATIIGHSLLPEKLIHGHIQSLLDAGVETIFYPCMSYNLDEGKGDNHYNCPVVAYYPEVIGANVAQIQQVRYISDYVGLHRRKDFAVHMHKILCKYFIDIGLKEVRAGGQCRLCGI